MPVHMEFDPKSGYWVVKDQRGDIKIKYKKRGDARAYVIARNIGEGHVPGMKPRKK